MLVKEKKKRLLALMIRIKKEHCRKTIVDLNEGAKGLHPFSTIFSHSAVLSQTLIHFIMRQNVVNEHNIKSVSSVYSNMLIHHVSVLLEAQSSHKAETRLRFQHCGMYSRKCKSTPWQPLHPNEYKSTDSRDYR